MNHILFAAAILTVSTAFAAADKYQTNVVPAQNQVRRAYAAFGAQPEKASLRILYVGNSITHHGAKPSIGWTNDCGMAASSIERDYVHVNAALVQKKVPDAAFAYLNVAGTLERTFMQPDWTAEKHFKDAKSFRPDIVVFFFGANVPQTYDADVKKAARTFGAAVAELREYLDGGKTRFLISEGFYKRPVLDAEKKAVARKYGDTFVEMGDIASRDDTHGRFNHPCDLGMRLIAERFFDCMKIGK